MKKCLNCGTIKSSDEYYNKRSVCKSCVCRTNSFNSFLKHIEQHQSLSGECWRWVVGYEGDYLVSNMGRIRSLKPGGRCGCILSPLKHKQGYLRVRCGVKTHLIHRLVADAFISNKDCKETVNHIDGRKDNNCVENLEWATQSENNQHAFDIGLTKYSRKSFLYAIQGLKVSIPQVDKMRVMYKKGVKQSELSEIFNISRAQVCRIVNYKSRLGYETALEQ